MIELIRYDTNTIAEDLSQWSSTLKRGAKIVTGAEKKLWVERFDGTGEITVEGPISSDLLSQLPKGCLVSHINSQDLMRIHTHQIVGNDKGEPAIKISGSSILKTLDERTYTAAAVPKYPNAQEKPEENITIGNTEENAVGSNNTANTPKMVVYFLMHQTMADSAGFNFIGASDVYVNYMEYPSGAFTDPRNTAAKKFVDTTEINATSTIGGVISPILKEFEIGVQIFREFYYDEFRERTIMFLVHGGADRTGDNGVHFRVGTDTIKKYSSINSNKSVTQGAIVQTTYFEFRIGTNDLNNGNIGAFDVKLTVIDASHVDSEYESKEAALDDQYTIIRRAYTYSMTELNKLTKETMVLEIDMAEDNQMYEYRRDFNLGDIVSIDSSAFYNAQPMRVVEFVESEDKGKFKSYPVLKSVNEGWHYNSHTVEAWDQLMNRS